jgi:ATP-dependent helicase/nuclease subunit A
VKPELTGDQRRAVDTDGIDLCVVAGAGTGKTRVLTDRIVRRVTKGGADLRGILAITFTEKAAAEMKTRLAAALELAGRANAREEVEAAAISTIHAFCARLLREHAVEAGVDPQFRVLDDVVSDARQREALDEFVAALHAGSREEFAALAQLPGEDPAATVLDVWRAARESGRDLAAFLATPAGMPPRAEFLAAIREDVGRAVETAGGAKNASADKARAAAAALAAFPPDDAPAAELGAAVARLRGSFSLQVSAAVKPWLANVRASCETLQSVLAEEALAPLRERLARAVVALEARYDAAKGGGRELDFVDLERRAVALLESRPDVRESVRERWGEVLVDEFQDVNPIQGRLVDLVRADGTLFVVGDPKQSIYGFRGAAVEVFGARRAEVAAADPRGEIALAASFRSRPEVLAVVNRLFRDGFPLGTPLASARKFAPRAAPCAELFVVDSQGAGDGREAEAAWIAERIAALADGPGRLDVGDPTDAEPLRTRKAGFGDFAVLLRTMTNVKTLERALTSRDVPYVVLKGRGFFEAREVVDLANLLACVDNPRDDLTLAAVLRSPTCGVTDDALFALCRARGEDLALADVIDGEVPEGVAARDRAALARFVAAWRALRAMRPSATIAALVDRALTSTRLATLALARPNGRQRAANLRKALALARTADADGRGDLRLFLASLRELREREVRETEAPVSGGAGAVSLMTVHAAKGLEFPIVFVPDLARGDAGERSPLATHAADGLGIRGGLDGTSFEDVTPWAFGRVSTRNAERERAEADRLLYVAVTRAEEHVVMTAAITDRERSRRRKIAEARAKGAEPDAAAGPPWLERVAKALDFETEAPAAGVHAAGVLVHETAPADADAKAGTRTLFHRVASQIADGALSAESAGEDARREADRLVAEASRAIPPHEGTLFSATVSGLAAFARCPQEFRLRHVVGAPESLAAAVGEGEGAEGTGRAGDDDEWGVPLAARALGRAVHLALERLVPEFEGDVAATVREALATETGGAPPDPADVERLAGWVRGFEGSDVGREVRSVPRAEVRREQALLFTAGRTVVRGQMDLVFRGPRGWTVVDYKAGGAGALSADYVTQMRLYAVGLAAITKEPLARLVLFSLPDAKAVDVPCSPDDAAAVRETLVAEFLDRTRRSDYAPRANPPCAACAYRGACPLTC